VIWNGAPDQLHRSLSSARPPARPNCKFLHPVLQQVRDLRKNAPQASGRHKLSSIASVRCPFLRKASAYSRGCADDQRQGQRGCSKHPTISTSPHPYRANHRAHRLPSDRGTYSCKADPKPERPQAHCARVQRVISRSRSSDLLAVIQASGIADKLWATRHPLRKKSRLKMAAGLPFPISPSDLVPTPADRRRRSIKSRPPHYARNGRRCPPSVGGIIGGGCLGLGCVSCHCTADYCRARPARDPKTCRLNAGTHLTRSDRPRKSPCRGLALRGRNQHTFGHGPKPLDVSPRSRDFPAFQNAEASRKGVAGSHPRHIHAEFAVALERAAHGCGG